MSLPISSAKALVTGANRGIGRALVEALLERGAHKVYATARQPEALADLVKAHPDRVVALALDVTDHASISAAAAHAADLNLLINNAGVANNIDPLEGDFDALRHELEVNYWGVLAATRAFLPALRQHERSSIVNINSVVSLTNFSTACTYSDSKAASHSLTLGLRQILSSEPIDIISVHPGPIETDMTADLDMPKVSAAYCANEILNGVETGAEEVFPDPFSVDFAPSYAAGPKVLEKRVREMLGR